MSLKAHMEEVKQRNEFEIYKPIRNKNQDLTTDSVAQTVEHRRDEPFAWIRILASTIILVCFLAIFLSLLRWRGTGRSNFVWGLQKLNNFDWNNHMQIWKITMQKIESTVVIRKKILLTKQVDQYPLEIKNVQNEVEICNLIGIKIYYLPTDTVAQWVVHRRD